MHLPILDFLGACCALVATTFFIRISILAWPISLIACGIDILLYCKKGIYADAGLNVIYLGMTLYGWYKWLYGGENRTEFPISNLSQRLAIKLAVLAIPFFWAIFFLLRFYTNSQIPYWDALTTTLSLAAQWLTCQKIIQNWYLWFIVDGLYIGIYFYKGIPMHALLQLIYLSMATIGYYQWQKKMQILQIANLYME